MIQINKPDYKSSMCNACVTMKAYKKISVGGFYSTTSIAFCEDCLEELLNKILETDEGDRQDENKTE